MKKYRVTYKNLEADGRPAKVEEVEADAWRVDDGYVALYRQEGGAEVRVFDVPKTRVMRIAEV